MNLREFARGKQCYVRISGVCNRNKETVVLAHVRKAGVAGTGQKPPDLCALPACSNCHDTMDGRKKPPEWLPPEQIDLDVFYGLLQWLAYLTEHLEISRKF